MTLMSLEIRVIFSTSALKIFSNSDHSSSFFKREIGQDFYYIVILSYSLTTEDVPTINY